MKFRNKITNTILPANPKAKFPQTSAGNFKGTTHKEFCRKCIEHNLVCPDTRSGKIKPSCTL